MDSLSLESQAAFFRTTPPGQGALPVLLITKPPRNRAARTGGPRFAGLGTNPLEPPPKCVSRIKSVEKATGGVAFADFASRADAISYAERLKAAHGDDMQVFLIEPKTTKSVTFDYPLRAGKPNGMNFRVSVFHPKTRQRHRKFFAARKDATAYADNMAALGWMVKFDTIGHQGPGQKPFQKSIYATRVSHIVRGGLPGMGKHH